jgi:hypothetical protein
VAAIGGLAYRVGYSGKKSRAQQRTMPLFFEKMQQLIRLISKRQMSPTGVGGE